jgi:hypothetical protein
VRVKRTPSAAMNAWRQAGSFTCIGFAGPMGRDAGTTGRIEGTGWGASGPRRGAVPSGPDRDESRGR